MELIRLSLLNIGNFRGKQTIDFQVSDPGKPVILIGGLNGAGKTTILDSLQLALFGRRSRPALESKKSFDDYLQSLIHRDCEDNEEAGLSLSFQLIQSGELHRFEIARRWNRMTKSGKPYFTVSVDGVGNPAVAEVWDDFVETIIPRGISDLFFFDGEQIEKLADSETSRKVLQSAVDNLLGLNLVSRLLQDIDVLRKRHLGRLVPKSFKAGIEEKRKKIGVLSCEIESLVLKNGDLTVELDRAKKDETNAIEEFKREGGDLAERRTQIENELHHARNKRKLIEEALRDLASGLLPLTMLDDEIKQLSEHLHERDSLRIEQEVNARLAAILDEIEVKIKDFGLPKEYSTSLQRVVERASVMQDGKMSRGLKSDSNQLDHFLQSSFQEALDRRQALFIELGVWRNKESELESVVASIPVDGSLREIKDDVEQAKRIREEAESKLARAEGELSSLRSRTEALRGELERELRRLAEAEFDSEGSSRIVEHSDRVENTLEQLRKLTISRNADELSKHVKDALEQLMRKEDFIKDIQISSEDYSLTLIGKDGVLLDPRTFSAGERQLLAIALLWGLGRASKKPLPVVIDTPLGRLDSVHREKVVSRYFSNASHQVVLLSTDTEIDDDLYPALLPFVAREYRLEFDQKEGKTQIQDGYFRAGV